jgi:hypothetical protein
MQPPCTANSAICHQPPPARDPTSPPPAPSSHDPSQGGRTNSTTTTLLRLRSASLPRCCGPSAPWHEHQKRRTARPKWPCCEPRTAERGAPPPPSLLVLWPELGGQLRWRCGGEMRARRLVLRVARSWATHGAGQTKTTQWHHSYFIDGYP